MIRVTIACPADIRDDANQLALCLGLGPEDANTYGMPIWQDTAGNRYAVASALVGEGFAAAATSPLAESPWGADLDAAARAQAAIQVGAVAGPDRLAASFDDDAIAAIAAMGLVRVEAEADA